ncbi:MAG: DUF1761 domain-containing protein [Rhodothermales bacterium]|nr:DUF1761 domain-containing protein [Rhodothermales bacterium]
MDINHLAVFTAAVVNMVTGAVWYSPALFGKMWMSENNLSDEMLSQMNPAKTYGLAFLAALIIAYNLAAFLADPGTDAAWGATAGFLAGFGFSGMALMAVALFEMKTFRYILINGGYVTVVFTLMGLIIGAWR